MPAFLDLTGKVFNWLTALRPIKKNGRWHWVCECECGEFVVVATANLQNNHTKSCGRCSRYTHGESGSPLYKVWATIKSSKRSRKICCKKWRDYKYFRDWALSNGWEQGLWIHRRGDKGNYSPENCYIAHRYEGARGGRSKNAALLPEDIPKIKQMAEAGMVDSKIAKLLGFNRRTIADVTCGKSWNGWGGY